MLGNDCLWFYEVERGASGESLGQIASDDYVLHVVMYNVII